MPKGRKRTNNDGSGRTTSKKKAKSTAANARRCREYRKREKTHDPDKPPSNTSCGNVDINNGNARKSKSDKKRPFVADPNSETKHEKSIDGDSQSQSNVRVPVVDITDQDLNSKRRCFSQDDMGEEELMLRQKAAIKIQRKVRGHIVYRLAQHRSKHSLESIKKSRVKKYSCGKCGKCKKRKHCGKCCAATPKGRCKDHRCSKPKCKRLPEVLQLTNHPHIFHKHMIKYYKKECCSPCHNCHRSRIVGLTGASTCYNIDMYLVPSYFIKELRSPLRVVKSTRSPESNNSCDLVLCEQCKTFLLDPTKVGDDHSEDELKLFEKNRWNWENVWPSFFWNLLTGIDETTEIPFYETYNAETLWKFVPGGIVRDFWRDSLLGLHNRILDKSTSVPEDIIEVYEPCVKNNSISHFVDRTEDVVNFRKNIKEYSIRELLLALDPQRVPFFRKEEGSNEEVDDEAIIDEFLTCRLCEDNSCDSDTSRSDKIKLIQDRKFKPMIIPDVLCPYGCSEFAHQCKHIDPSLLIQAQLRKVQLNLCPDPDGHSKMYLADTARQDYIRRDDEVGDFVLMNKDWPIKPTMQLEKGKGLVICVCRYHGKTSERKYLLHHPPRKHQNNLSAVRPDSLCHAHCRPRTVSTVKSSKYNSSSTLTAFSSSYAGSDCSNVCREPWGCSSSYMMYQHELLSFSGRRDIHELAHHYVKEEKIPSDFLNDWSFGANIKFGSEDERNKLELLKRGSTYTPTYNALILQKHASDSSKIAAVILQRDTPGGPLGERDALLERSWSPTIHNMQMNDPDGWGWPIKGIAPYASRNNNSTMMLWCLCSMISACNPLHYAIDQKVSPHRYDGWTAHLLAHINKTYMKHNEVRCPQKSPFSGVSNEKLRVLVEKFMPEEMLSYSGASDDHPEYYYKLSLGYFKSLFPEDDFPNVSFHSRTRDFLESRDADRRKNTDVVVVVTDTCPDYSTEATFSVGNDGPIFEARVVMSISADTSGEDTSCASKFSAIRYARHGGGFSQWWVQERDGTKHKSFMRQYVHQKDKIYGSDPFPKLPKKAFCYIVVYVNAKQSELEKYRLDMYRSVGTQGDVFCNCTNDNPLIVCGKSPDEKRCCMMDKCNKVETYTCGRLGCTTRICKDCFMVMNKGPGPITVLTPPTIGASEDVHPAETPQASDNDEECEFDGIDCHEDNKEDEYTNCLNSDEYDDPEGDTSRVEEYIDDDPNDENNVDVNDDYGGHMLEEETDDEYIDGIDDDLYDDPNDENIVDVNDDYGGHMLQEEIHDKNIDDRELSLRNRLVSARDKVERSLPFDIHSDEVLAKEKKWLPWGIRNFHSNTKKFYDEWYLKQGESVSSTVMVDRFIEDGYKYVEWSDDNKQWNDRFDVTKESDKLLLNDALRRKAFLPAKDYIHSSVDDLLKDYATGANTQQSSLDDGDASLDGQVPKTNGADIAYTFLERGGGVGSNSYYGSSVPMHVLFNQAGSLCTRFNKRIRGSQVQQNFVQKLVSSVRGYAFPLLYFAATLFPRHFWASATHDETAILGCPPISCMRKASHPDGFASSIQVARNLATHSSSSASTCHSYTAFSYEMQTNRASSGIDSRLVARHGFRVSTTTRSGLELADGDDSQLHESLDSRQGAMNLAAASQFVDFDAFVTLTCNQSEHPGIRHLHNWKESKRWTDSVENYDKLSIPNKKDVDRSFEMAYTSVLNRAWLEVRKLILEFITYSTTFLLKRPIEVFFRDEYQEKSGNLCHIHGLIALCKDDLENEKFQELVCDLQKNAVCDLFDPADIEEYMNEGLFSDQDDWRTCEAKASEVLEHKCDQRCQIRVDHKGTEEDTKCKKPHPEFDSVDPFEDDFIPFKYDWSDNCLKILYECGLYEPPSLGFPKGKFFNKVLRPTRHMGKVTPGTGGNMSPVTPKLFALTRSMQNFQVITNTNGVSRYVVKYIIKMDTGNRCIVHADKHTGAVLRAEHQFLHNTKVTRSAINEQKAWMKSRKSNNPVGRFISFNEFQHQLLGINDVFTTMKFVSIPSKPLEQRSTTKIQLDRKGNLMRPDQSAKASDVTSSITDVHAVREKNLPSRQLSSNQVTILSAKNMESRSYCKISLFGVRPVELMELFPRIGDYYRWFITEEKILGCSEIQEALVMDVTKCHWIDGLGRRVKLRHAACKEVIASLNKVQQQSVKQYSWILRNHLLEILQGDKKPTTLVAEDDGMPLPIPVFSNITPRNPSWFLLHIMLLLGEVGTELDLKDTESMKHSLAISKLIPSDNLDNEEMLLKYSNNLLRRVITEVFPILPITMRMMEEYIVMTKRLLDSVLLSKGIPVTDLPPCILTQMLNNTDEELKKEWDERTKAQLNAMLSTIPPFCGLPPRDEIVAAVEKREAIKWDPLQVITCSKDQSPDSFKEQRTCISMGISAVNNYRKQFGPITQSKGVLAHGSPGSGKSFVLEAQGLYAMSQGLRVMSTSLMAVRSNALGGYHIHKLFTLEVTKNANLFRLAELAMDKLERKSNIKMKHIILSMDVLLLDECGQLSAQQFALLDIVLRHVRHNDIPFGGVLIFGTFDHAQLGAIQGLPFVLSSHILTDFNLIRMKHSVRAHNDPDLQEIQNITRMSPSILKNSKDLKERFGELIRKTIQFADDWDDPKIVPNTQKMYSKRNKAVKSAEVNSNRIISMLKRDSVHHVVSRAEDFQQIAGSRVVMVSATDNGLKSQLDRKCREPKTLVFYSGALFEATVNGKNYSQSQILRLINVPTQEQVDNREPIFFMASPSGNDHYSINTEDAVPTEEELKKQGWTKVKIETGRDDQLITHGIYQGKRVQYSVTHLGSSTINKQMGNTILCPVAIEMTQECCPWEKGQVVVMLSRSPLGKLITIVGKPDFAIERMWSILCKSTQWTPLMESILNKLSIEGDGEEIEDSDDKGVLELAELYPFRVCNIELPTAESGYVYLLMSTPHPERTYVGQCRNLGRRIRNHNSGFGGSAGTASAIYRPYAPVAYLTNLGHMSDGDRMSLENSWQLMNNEVNGKGEVDIEARIENGRRVMVNYNENNPRENHIRLIKCIQT